MNCRDESGKGSPFNNGGFCDEKIDQLSDENDESPKPAVVAFTVSKTAGEAIGLARQFVDALDVFTSQYLSLTTAAYITFKFLHFRVFD